MRAWIIRLSGFLFCLFFAAFSAAQEKTDVAPIVIDGKTLFHVHGIETLPAPERAKQITERIEGLAADSSFPPEDLQLKEVGELTAIVGGEVVVMGLSDLDAKALGEGRSLIAKTYETRIRAAIIEYRDARSFSRLAVSAGFSVIAIVVAIVALVLLRVLLKRVEALLHSYFDNRMQTLTTESRSIFRIERLWQIIHAMFTVLRNGASIMVVLFLLKYILMQFPWTSTAGNRLFSSVGRQLKELGLGFLSATPNILFLVILFFITRYGLSLARLYFNAIQVGRITVSDFYPEWAQPIYKLVRAVVIAVALAIAYPFIPGSNSDAFKGLSIIAGVILSIASTTAMANTFAGYMLLFRRAFHAGDLVKIGDVVGFITDMRLQVTHIRTIKNEEITLPNSQIMACHVTNLSKPSREGRLILHSEVGVGYEVPWRQVEAMLIEAAQRTDGLLKDPPPFVFQLKLNDFAIAYQINAYSNRAEEMSRILSDLHRNILDLFNEHEVQIMTPAYENDPKEPKVVSKDQWFAAPAKFDQRLDVH